MVIVLKEDEKYLTRAGEWSNNPEDAAVFPEVESAHAVSVLLELANPLITLRFDSGEEITRPLDRDMAAKS